MITQNEINSLSLSPTKKDFVQIWNELLEVAGKLSERWDPTSTNESDPGIVILKALTGIADKLNYNIDKNTLEAFMPTASQEDSMRKLCDMLGYNIKYYQSAAAKVTIKYSNSNPSEAETSAMSGQVGVNQPSIPKFTVITNSDGDISYFTTNETPIYISSITPSIENIPCLEGQIVKCESINTNNIITISQISENNRFYLPETQIAENGIFIYNVKSNEDGTALGDGTKWEKVDNLNTQARGTRVYKFGFDSYKSRPYVEFPEDYSELFNDGLFLYYTRTSGAAGSVSARTLTSIELPTGGAWADVEASSISVENTFASVPGANIETIKQAYNNFKKTVGTFETLVTCRDYMNKIYLMTDDNNKFLVSNILVTDIRSDLNKAVTICSCDDAGVFYKETPLMSTSIKTKTENIGDDVVLTTKIITDTPKIDHFDLVLYPYKAYNQIKNNVTNIRNVYDSSFNCDMVTFEKVHDQLKLSTVKSIAHNIVAPAVGDIVSINNYLKLNATISTNSKITADEGTLIIDKIKIALANAFNMRELDFGEEIPFDSILEVIENADTRIRIVSLNDPTLYTTFSVYTGKEKGAPEIVEYAVASDWLTVSDANRVNRFTHREDGNKLVSTFDTDKARSIYNKLAVRNILAGRVPLFKYNNKFKANFYEYAYQVTSSGSETEKPKAMVVPTKDNPFTIYTENDVIYTGLYHDDAPAEYQKTYTPEAAYLVDSNGNKIAGTEVPLDVISTVNENNITDITTTCKILSDKEAGKATGIVSDVELKQGEFVKFRAPNFITTKTYPAYVNYHLVLDKTSAKSAIPAEAESLFEILNTDARWQMVLDYFTKVDNGVFGTQKSFAYKKKFTLSQKVSKYASVVSSEEMLNSFAQNPENLTLDSSTVSISEAIERLKTSGCIKLVNPELKAILKWEPAEGETKPYGDGPDLGIHDIVLPLDSPFITDSATLNSIQEVVASRIYDLKTLHDSGTAVLPTECSWTISFEFECVPFTSESLEEWERFIKSSNQQELVGFTPELENGTIFWRLYGEGYKRGKGVLDTTEKLKKFSSDYFESLANMPSNLAGIYLVKTFGADAELPSIDNGVERRLTNGEFLYIEYTPSTTTEDGTSKESSAVTEIYGEGTIIRPSGFEYGGIVDSEAYVSLGNSYHKNVVFENPGKVELGMHSFGVNEQVEIREISEVVLNKNKLKSTSAIWYYKNFNGCPELEEKPVFTDDKKEQRINNVYTLKDGEYIFYTDDNQSEFAYFSAGTQVTLGGDLVLDNQFEIVDLVTIFESGVSSIPWARKTFKNNDSLTFTEYQYLTLGSGDKINKIKLLDNTECLSDAWQWCDEVEYTVAGADSSTSLDEIDINYAGSKGCGWQVCSMLELNASASIAQILRNTDKIQTCLTLVGTSDGDAKSTMMINVSELVNNKSETVEEADSEEITKEDYVRLLFKTNLSCLAEGNTININDVYSNTDKLSSFEIKFFAEDYPAIVETEPGKVIPPYSANIKDLTTWKGTSLAVKEFSNLWNSVDLDNIKASSDQTSVDNALRLPINILNDTYGIFCVYLNYLNSNASNLQTWIEVVPGTSHDDVTLLNVSKDDIVWETAEANTNKSDKLFLLPGINCVRINRNSKIFIKTSANSQGTLLFDELQLVNCKSVDYTDPFSDNPDHKLKTKRTYGLNVEQLGYLNQKGLEDTTVLDSEMLNELKIDSVNKAITRINASEQIVNESINILCDRIFTSADKLQKFVSFTTATKEEITRLLDLYKADYAALLPVLTTYSQLYEELTYEEELLKALDNNKNTEEFEKQLASLLNSFSKTEDLQQALDELENVRHRATQLLEQFSKEEILEDFAKASITSDLISELATASESIIETNYNEQLIPIVASVEEVVNSEERTRLLNVLDSLKATATAGKRSELNTKVKQLVDTFNNTEPKTLLDALLTAIISANYDELEYSLRKLRDLLSNSDTSTLVNEIEQAANEQSDAYLKILVKALTSLAPANSTHITTIDNILAMTNTDSKLSQARSLYTTLSGVYGNSQLINIAKQIYLEETASGKLTTSGILYDLETISASYNTAINSLLDSKDEQVSKILEKLTAITTNRINELTKVKNVLSGTSTYDKLPFIDDAALSIWPEHMKKSASEVIKEAYNIIRKAIIDKIIVTNNLPSNLLNSAEFTALYEEVKNAIQKLNQNSARETLINSLHSVVPINQSLNKAMQGILDNNSTRTVIIRELITEILATTNISKKQKLIKKLRDELTSNITIDKQLTNLAAELICPSVLLFEQKLPEAFVEDSTDIDSFFEELADFIIGTSNGVRPLLFSKAKAATSATAAQKAEEIKVLLEAAEEKLGFIVDKAAVTSVATLSELVTKKDVELLKKFVASVADFDSYKTASLLASEYLTLFSEFSELLTTQTEIATARNIKLFKLLNTAYAKEVLISDKADPSKSKRVWVDIYGNEFPAEKVDKDHNPLDKYGNRLTLRKSIDGKWTDETGAVITVKTDDGLWLDINNKTVLFTCAELIEILDTLLAEVTSLTTKLEITSDFKEAYTRLKLEEQLLADIQALDRERAFYYTTPVDMSLAIDFNESSKALNTLMNPAINYDINNINNNFVISKLDIDYLDSGIQIARSSRLN